ncbi:DUF7159 family protein [Mycobacterium decipiens]|uniref:DUF7159 domain-containing protein n=1 Tax=Mycobacterium decipiens TaxID=1430326 RepID=A0A1X2LSL7_9MYCO|nr:hypothetical protein [Mycobacterium decipiens]OSC39751.1 hypothetical protein B8W66_15660 [Mycobacterium decipiens]
MDTVLGLSITPTTVGWVLAEGHGADGTILDRNELELHGGRDVRAVNTAEQLATEVLRAKEVATAGDHRLRVIGVTWNDEASAQAALLLELLTGAGFDNLVPIRMLDAIETLGQAIAPIIGYEQTAVCVLEHEWATVVMIDTHDAETRTAVKRVRGGLSGLTSWLTGMFDRDSWRPAGVVVVGSDSDVSAFAWQLEKVLPVPVFAQTMAQVTVARGAALAAAQSTEFTDARLLADTTSEPAVAPTRSRHYAGAATTLAAAAVTFVASLSLAVGMQLAPHKDPETTSHRAHASTPRIAEAEAPAKPSRTVEPPAPVAAPEPATHQEPPVHLTSGAALAEPNPTEAPAEGEPNASAPQQDRNDRQLILTRVLEHIPGAYGDSPADPAE